MTGFDILLIVFALALIFIAGANWGYNHGVVDTEERWHEAATRTTGYWANQLHKANEETQRARKELRVHLEAIQQARAARVPRP